MDIEMTEDIDTEIMINDLFIILPIIIFIVPVAILIFKLFPDWYDNHDKYFKSFKEFNPSWFGKEI